MVERRPGRDLRVQTPDLEGGARVHFADFISLYKIAIPPTLNEVLEEYDSNNADSSLNNVAVADDKPPSSPDSAESDGSGRGCCRWV